MASDIHENAFGGPHLAVVGTFDVAYYGDLLFPRIFEREIRDRCEMAEVVPYAPYGWEHPVPLDGGRYARPLGPWTPARCAQMADDYDMSQRGSRTRG